MTAESNSVSDTEGQGRPPGWRPEWREPKAKRPSRAQVAAGIARARVEVLGPLPAPAEIHDRAVAVLLEIAEDSDCDPSPRVGAARTLVELATRGRVGGNDETRMSDAELQKRIAEIEDRVFARRKALAEGAGVVTDEAGETNRKDER